MPRQNNPVPIIFPLGGVNEDPAFAGQPGTVIVNSVNVRNMRPYDVVGRRKRGGSRQGAALYTSAAINGSNPVQGMETLVEAFDPNNVVADTQLVSKDFTGFSDGPLPTVDTDFTGYSQTFTSLATGNNILEVNTGQVQVNAAGTTRQAALYNQAITPGLKYVIRWRARSKTNGNEWAMHYRLHPSDPITNQDSLQIDGRRNGSGLLVIPRRKISGVVADYAVTTGSTTATSLIVGANTDFQDYELQVNGDVFRLLVNGSEAWTATNTTASSQNAFGLGVTGAAGDDSSFENWSVFTAITPATLRATSLIAVSGGDIAKIDPATRIISIPSGGSAALVTSGRVGIRAAFTDVFFADGLSANYQYYDSSTDTVKDWATDVTAGALPAGSVDTTIGALSLSLYRGRIVAFRMREEPQNWFMSVAGDPFDWDYAPATTSPTQAIAGNNSVAGELGDIMTAGIPFQDDLFFMGGNTSLWVMRGDPAAGGNIDNISRQVGVLGPDAWTWDTGSTLYFFGQNGLYMLTPNSSEPQLISEGKLDKLFNEIDFGLYNVRLEYNRELQGIHIFIVPEIEPASSVIQWWWDKRTNGFWPDTYPTNFGPSATLLFEADKEANRGILVAGYDGFIRIFTDSALNDESTAIDSYIRFPLLHPNIPQGQFQIDDLQMHLDSAGSGATLEIYRGKTPQEASLSSTVVHTKALVAGRNLPIRKKIRANAIQFLLQNNTLGEAFAYENGTVMLAGVGRQRAGL